MSLLALICTKKVKTFQTPDQANVICHFIPRMASSRFFHQIFGRLSGIGFYSDRKMVVISIISEFQSIYG